MMYNRHNDDNQLLACSAEPPVTIIGNSISQEQQCLMAGDDLILACEVSRPDAPVQWYCNDSVLSSNSRTCVESYGTVRRLIILGLEPSDSGRYMCDAIDDKIYTTVKVQGMTGSSVHASV